MAVGSEAKAAVRSYVAVGKESTFGTYASATTAIAALSCTFRTDVDSMKLDQLSGNRGYSHRVTLAKNVEGALEQYLHPIESVLLLANAMGGGVVSTSQTACSVHSITAGNYDTSTAIKSLSFNVRKGSDGTTTFHYIGGVVDSLKLTGKIGEPIQLSAEIIFKDSTMLVDDISSSLSLSSIAPFTFVNGSFRYLSSESSIGTATANEPIQSFELIINNNVVSGDEVRSLGTITVDVLPATRRDIEIKVTNRWDTTTTFNRFIQATQGAIELFFQGASISAEHNNEMTIRLPRVYNKTGDTEIGGMDEILITDIDFDVVIDGQPFTSTSREIGLTVKNALTAF